MDFLDPRKRRAHKIRLIIGYGLVSIGLILVSLILLYGGSGYGINTKTGGIIQNGLLFVDSKPGGANIYLDDKDYLGATSKRLVLPAGTYSLSLSKDGYRDWHHQLLLPESKVVHYVYPLLFPLKLEPKALKAYTSNPPLITQSPDRRWLLVQIPSGDSKTIIFDLFDTTKPTQAAKQLAFPQGLLANADKPEASLKAVEWTSDSKQVLLSYNFNGGSEFVIFNREEPAKSLNLNKFLNNNPSQVSLVDKKANQLLVFDQSRGLLSQADVPKKSFVTLLEHVLAFKDYRSDLFSYVTDQGMPAGQVMARIWDKGKTYPLYSFAAGPKYLLDATEFQGHWYYVAGSDSASRVNIYKDPLDGLKDPQANRAIALISLGSGSAGTLSFSFNGRFAALQAGQKFTVYDIETQSRYQFSLSKNISGPFVWMDGHRWIGQSDGSILIMDYDGTNQNLMVSSINPEGGYFDRDYRQLFNLASTGEGSTVVLEITDLRAGQDLPKANQ